MQSSSTGAGWLPIDYMQNLLLIGLVDVKLPDVMRSSMWATSLMSGLPQGLHFLDRIIERVRSACGAVDATVDSTTPRPFLDVLDQIGIQPRNLFIVTIVLTLMANIAVVIVSQLANLALVPRWSTRSTIRQWEIRVHLRILMAMFQTVLLGCAFQVRRIVHWTTYRYADV